MASVKFNSKSHKWAVSFRIEISRYVRTRSRSAEAHARPTRSARVPSTRALAGLSGDRKRKREGGENGDRERKGGDRSQQQAAGRAADVEEKRAAGRASDVEHL